MSEFRKDPIVGRWVIIAEDRAGRPHEFETAERRLPVAVCPFCEGNEENTPAEILACREPGSKPDGRGWRVRVLPNKFPALTLRNDMDRRSQGIYVTMGGVGAHDVIVESPAHLASTSQLNDEQACEVFTVYRDRLIALKQDTRLRYGLVFKNVGAAAGASLEHTHSQLIATHIVPTNVQDELVGSSEHFRGTGHCVFCDVIGVELAGGARLVASTPRMVAVCPFASRFPYETWVLPRRHESYFEQADHADLEELSRLMRRIIGRIEAVLDRPAYNYLIHTTPFDSPPLDHYHWHIEILPRTATTAGFEWGTGYYINPLAPENAAARLRAVDDDPS